MVSEGKRHSLHSEHKLLIPATVLRSVVVKMHGAFPRLCKEWNVASCMRKNWARLFEHMDADGSGRLHFEEFLEAWKPPMTPWWSPKRCGSLPVMNAPRVGVQSMVV